MREKIENKSGFAGVIFGIEIIVILTVTFFLGRLGLSIVEGFILLPSLCGIIVNLKMSLREIILDDNNHIKITNRLLYTEILPVSDISVIESTQFLDDDLRVIKHTLSFRLRNGSNTHQYKHHIQDAQLEDFFNSLTVLNPEISLNKKNKKMPFWGFA